MTTSHRPPFFAWEAFESEPPNSGPSTQALLDLLSWLQDQGEPFQRPTSEVGSPHEDPAASTDTEADLPREKILLGSRILRDLRQLQALTQANELSFESLWEATHARLDETEPFEASVTPKIPVTLGLHVTSPSNGTSDDRATSAVPSTPDDQKTSAVPSTLGSFATPAARPSPEGFFAEIRRWWEEKKQTRLWIRPWRETFAWGLALSMGLLWFGPRGEEEIRSKGSHLSALESVKLQALRLEGEEAKPLKGEGEALLEGSRLRLAFHLKGQGGGYPYLFLITPMGLRLLKPDTREGDIFLSTGVSLWRKDGQIQNLLFTSEDRGSFALLLLVTPSPLERPSFDAREEIRFNPETPLGRLFRALQNGERRPPEIQRLARAFQPLAQADLRWFQIQANRERHEP